MHSRRDARNATFIAHQRTSDRMWQKMVDERLAEHKREARRQVEAQRHEDFLKRRSLTAFSMKLMAARDAAPPLSTIPRSPVAAHPRPFLGTDRRAFSVASQRSSKGLASASSTSSLAANYFPPPTSPPMVALGVLPPPDYINVIRPTTR